jgi:hypothetical protein
VRGKRARFVQATRQLIDNYTARRQARSMPVLRAVPTGGLETMREIVFSACLSSEVALESQGHGDFTQHALQVLGQGNAGLTNGAFAERVTQAFGEAPQQHTKLYSSDAGRLQALLQPLVAEQRRAIPADRRAPAINGAAPASCWRSSIDGLPGRRAEPAAALAQSPRYGVCGGGDPSFACLVRDVSPPAGGEHYRTKEQGFERPAPTSLR